jgi:hypothetical protein
MSTTNNTNKETTKAHRARNPGQQADHLDNPLASWRTLRALDFSFHDVTSLRTVLAKTTLLGQPKWAAAVAGDGAAAVAVAISFIPAEKITQSLDLAMTALIACAIEGDPGAAIVASNILRHLPGATPRHHQIATSWFVSNLATCASRKAGGAATEAAPLANAVEWTEPSEFNAAAPKSYELWRTIPATEFNESHRSAVVEYIAESLPGVETKAWMGAIAGDALCAIRIAREITIPVDGFTRPLDARLTLLLHCALTGSADAALALSSLLRRMPLDATAKKRLVASWLVRGRLIEDVGEPEVTPRRSRLRLVPKLLGDREDAS